MLWSIKTQLSLYKRDSKKLMESLSSNQPITKVSDDQHLRVAVHSNIKPQDTCDLAYIEGHCHVQLCSIRCVHTMHNSKQGRYELSGLEAPAHDAIKTAKS